MMLSKFLDQSQLHHVRNPCVRQDEAHRQPKQGNVAGMRVLVRLELIFGVQKSQSVEQEDDDENHDNNHELHEVAEWGVIPGGVAESSAGLELHLVLFSDVPNSRNSGDGPDNPTQNQGFLRGDEGQVAGVEAAPHEAMAGYEEDEEEVGDGGDFHEEGGDEAHALPKHPHPG